MRLIQETNQRAAKVEKGIQEKITKAEEYLERLESNEKRKQEGTYGNDKETYENDEETYENEEEDLEIPVDFISVHLEYHPNTAILQVIECGEVGKVEVYPCLVDPSKTTWTIDKEYCREGEMVTMTVNTRHTSGLSTYCPRDALAVAINDGSKSEQLLQCIDSKTGIYQFELTAGKPGVYHLSVKVNGKGATSAHELTVLPPEKFSVENPLGIDTIDINPSTSLVLVCGRKYHEVKMFLSHGAFVRTIGSGRLKQPCCVVHLLDSNLLLVSDVGNDAIYTLTNTGDFVGTFCKSGHGKGEVRGPLGLSLGKDGEVLVCDSVNNRIQVLSSNGDFIRSFGGRESMHFRYCVYSHGLYYVTASGHTRVSVFNDLGEFVDVFRDCRGAFHVLHEPRGLAVSPDGQLVAVCEKDKHMVHIYRDRRLERSIGSFGRGPRQFNMPQDVKWLGESQIIVSDYGNNRLQVLDLLEEGCLAT
ncbi:tripartite motif-containing protein 3 [Nematostella vectensis]|uniref:tripartite motif-containing protein 3 n=1 Tax=Nematostella vectensis TaxID=45351 RepID=UPI002076EF8A|nr:tripartite motif-containing protein 3 [Nematostella vectensis]